MPHLKKKKEENYTKIPKIMNKTHYHKMDKNANSAKSIEAKVFFQHKLSMP